MKGVLFSLMTLLFFTVLSGLVFLVFTMNNNYDTVFLNSISASRTAHESRYYRQALFKATNLYYSLSTNQSVNLTSHFALNPLLNVTNNLAALDGFLTVNHEFSNLLSSANNGFLEHEARPHGVVVTNNFSENEFAWTGLGDATLLELGLDNVNSISWENTTGSLVVSVIAPGFHDYRSVGSANVTVNTGSANLTWRVSGLESRLLYANCTGGEANLTVTLPGEEWLRIDFVEDYDLNVSNKGFRNS